MNNDNEADCEKLPRAEIIARLNDILRKSCEGGTVVFTRNVRGLEGFNAPDLVKALAEYDGSTKIMIRMVNAISVIFGCLEPTYFSRSTIMILI